MVPWTGPRYWLCKLKFKNSNSVRRTHIHKKLKRIRPKKKFYRRPMFWVTVTVLCIGVVGYLVVWLPAIQISTITIEGNQKVSTQKIAALVAKDAQRTFISMHFFSLSTKSIVMVSTQKISGDLLKTFPIIENAVISKKYPNSLLVVIQERQPFAAFCPGVIEGITHCLDVDSNGVAFEPAGNDSLTISSDQFTNQQVFTGEQVINKNLVNTIATIQKNLKDNFQINIQQAFVSNPLVFTTSEGWKVYFDPSSDIQLQLTKMDTLLNGEISQTDRKNLQYIYLQYKDRAYYK